MMVLVSLIYWVATDDSYAEYNPNATLDDNSCELEACIWLY